MFNSDVSLKEFLHDYWQQKPLLFRNAFPDFKSPLNADELAGLACEKNSNARLIIETEDKPYWSVEYSPIEESRFSSLPHTNWTLLVSDIEKLIPEGRELLEHFRFIPDWRIDDLMISYAVKGGSVGPHIDAYDVFLLQAEGQRHWGISNAVRNNKSGEDELLKDIDLRVLKSFNAETEWTLNPGDMLYLPPNMAHHGIAVEDCITCSIGFRSPSVHTMISEYAESLAATLPRELRYTDANIQQQKHPGEITQESFSSVKQLLIDHLKTDDDFIQRWFGEHLTESNDATPINQKQAHDPVIHNLDELRDTNILTTALTTKFLYCRYKDNALVFVDGQSFETSIIFAETLCKSHRVRCKDVIKSIQTNEDEITLLKLLSQGHLYRVD